MEDTGPREDVNSVHAESFRRLSANLRRADFEEYLYRLTRHHGGLVYKDTATPLAIFVMAQVDLATIKSFYQMDPTAPTWKLLHDACRYGAAPGVVPFLAQKMVETNDFDHNSGRELFFLINFALENGPGDMRLSEDELKSMLEIHPTMLSYEPGELLKMCLDNGYSEDLFEFMLQKSPNKIDHLFLFSSEYTKQDIRWMTKIFPKIHGEVRTATSQTWKEGSHTDLLRLLFLESNHVTKVSLQLPRTTLQLDPDLATTSFTRLTDGISNSPPTHSNLEDVEIGFAALSKTHFAIYVCILDWISCLPCLRKLTLRMANHHAFVDDRLCTTLKRGKLEHLLLYGSFRSESNKRKRSPEDQLPLGGLFESLKQNKSLTSLRWQGISTQQHLLHGQLLVEALKQNDTIQTACLRAYPGQDLDDDAKQIEKEISHYTALNLCGRKQARESSTNRSDLVDLLSSVVTKVDDGGAVTSLQYGLLLETVCKWCGSQTSSGSV